MLHGIQGQFTFFGEAFSFRVCCDEIGADADFWFWWARAKNKLMRENN